MHTARSLQHAAVTNSISRLGRSELTFLPEARDRTPHHEICETPAPAHISLPCAEPLLQIHLAQRQGETSMLLAIGVTVSCRESSTIVMHVMHFLSFPKHPRLAKSDRIW